MRSCLSLAFAAISIAASAQNLLGDGGFESPSSDTISPLNPANWASDLPYFIDASGRYNVMNGAVPQSSNSAWRSDLLAKEGSHYLLLDGPTSSDVAVLTSTQAILVVAGESYSSRHTWRPLPTVFIRFRA